MHEGAQAKRAPPDGTPPQGGQDALVRGRPDVGGAAVLDVPEDEQRLRDRPPLLVPAGRRQSTSSPCRGPRAARGIRRTAGIGENTARRPQPSPAPARPKRST